MKKICCSLILLVLFTACVSTISYAADTIFEAPDVKINIDAASKTYLDVPIVVNGSTMLPLRALLVDLGIQNDDQHIIWNSTEKSITIIKESIKIKLTQGSKIAFVNEAQVTLDVAPVGYSKNGRTYIPARFVAQSLGKSVFWDGTTKTVFIITPTTTTVSSARQYLSGEYAEKAYLLDEVDGKTAEALQCFDIAIELDPYNYSAYYWKGRKLKKDKEYDKALIYLDKAIEIDPSITIAYIEKARLFNETGKYDEAIQCFDKAIQIEPRDVDPYYGKGISLIKLQKYDEAVKVYDKALEIDDKSIASHVNKGVALSYLDKNEEAIVEFDKAIEIDPDYAIAYYDKACVYSIMNKKDDAILNLKIAIELDNKFKDMAATDQDFGNISESEEFQDLIK